MLAHNMHVCVRGKFLINPFCLRRGREPAGRKMASTTFLFEAIAAMPFYWP